MDDNKPTKQYDLFGQEIPEHIPQHRGFKNKDWTGNSVSTFKGLGASNHAAHEREEYDFYATEPLATKLLTEIETFQNKIWEPACGLGHMAEPLKQAGYDVYATDIIDRGYGNETKNFLTSTGKWDGDIITNPPYKYAEEFVFKALSLVNDGAKVAMFLKLLFLETQGRQHLFQKHPPYRVYVSRSRLICAMNGDFETYNKQKGSGAIAYAWFVWVNGFTGPPEIHWFN